MEAKQLCSATTPRTECLDVIVAPVDSTDVDVVVDGAATVVRLSTRTCATAGMEHTGNVIWDASRQLAKWVGTGFLRGKDVLEIGAGVSGLPGLVAHLSGATRVTLTDLPAECDTLRRNVAWNLCPVAAGGGTTLGEDEAATCPCCRGACERCPLVTGSVRIAALDWRDEAAFVGREPFDAVIAGDVLYDDTLPAVCDMIQRALSGAHSHWSARAAYMVNTSRTAVHKFRRRMVAAGLVVEDVALPWTSDVAWIVRPRL
jgi:predicted nicotinamide N-methyase